jgi:outer membrane receptor for ferrienterochelin and colicin
MQGKEVNISGILSCMETGESLIGVNVYSTTNQKGTITNNAGFYSFSHEAGKVIIEYSYIGYETEKLEIELKSDTIINVKLNVSSSNINEIVVRNKSTGNPNLSKSYTSLSVKEISKIPIIFGEADILKVLQLYPGIQTGSEATSGIYVRGGSSDQNLFLVDGVPVYNANHLLGFFSSFNQSALKSVKIYKAGFPARYGGRLSSVIDIRLKDGNMKKIEGNYSIGLISSKLYIEGPLIKDKASFMIALRRSYADFIAKPIIAMNNTDESKSYMDLYFYDINSKLNYVFNDRSRLFWSFFRGKDKFLDEKLIKGYDNNLETSNRYSSEIGWVNTTSSLKWNYILGKKIFSAMSLTYSKFEFGVGFENSTSNDDVTLLFESNTFKSGIEDFSMKIDFEYYPTNKHSVKFGLCGTRHHFFPGISIKNSEEPSQFKQNIFSNELEAFIEDEFSLTKKISLNYGLHASYYRVEGQDYLRIQPRSMINYEIFNELILKASYSRMAQHLHKLSMSGIDLPTDLWVPVTKNFGPPISDQFAIGLHKYNFHNIDVSTEIFYKNMYNLIEYKDGISFSGNSQNWEDLVEQGKGWSYGFELMLEKKNGPTTGWFSYTWSKSEREFSNINFGKVFPHKYDRRHNISIVCNHQFNKKVDLSLTWVYSSGNNATVALSQYILTGVPDYPTSFIYYLNNIEGRNNYSLPSYHRLDMGLNLHKQKPRGVRTWNFSIYNAYNKQNIFMLSWRYDFENTFIDEHGSRIHPKKLYNLSLFPIIPSISYSFKF